MFTPSKLHWVLLSLLVALSRVQSTASFHLHPDEVVAIESIKSALGANGSTWPVGDPCKNPYTVTIFGESFGGEAKNCDNRSVVCDCFNYGNGTCHITRLCLKGLSFPGSLPPELANLPHLEFVDLTRNCLTGSIPPQWASLEKLKNLSLSANLLSGNIPKGLSKFSSLTYLSIEANQFNGTVPVELGSMVNLTVLSISSNQLEGSLPNTLALLTNLKQFSASDNKLSGSIPEFIANWSNLEILQLYASGLEGSVPPAIFYLKNLKDLRITDTNGKESHIPNVPKNMETLILRSVDLTGPIPEEIWNVTTVVDLTFNKLQIDLPEGAPLTKALYLSGNDLSGDVSTKFSQTKKDVDLSYNSLSWPSNCEENTKLNTYRSSPLQGNISGLLPCSGVPLKCPEGELYDSFNINCGGEEVNVTNEHGYLLYDADDADKDAAGPARSYVNGGRHWGFSSTGSYLNANENINEYILKNNSALLMDNAELYTRARRSPLSLTYFGYCLKNGSYNVHLHFAEIQFTEERGYMKVGRRLFDIYVQRKLEQRDFDIRKAANGSRKSYTLVVNNTMVNDGTLEIRLYWAGRGTTLVPKRGNYGPIISAISVCSSLKEHCEVTRNDTIVKPRSTQNEVPLIAKIGASAACLLFLVMGIICWKYCFHDRYRRRRDLQGLDLQTGTFTLRQLKAATRNFDPMNKLGEGGFGAVYKGELANGTFIAVKQLSSKSKQGNREFVNEIGMISGLLHPNLVKLYGCCIEGNNLLLVYEYMENNCLAHLLFAKNSEERSRLTLDWRTRVRICVGVARGLAFLHEGSTLRIVHRDIKATNVLLDRDMNAKISDFGLAKLNEEENTHISTRVAGTIGYMAPEYALWGYLTDKADVYAFGVVALEIVSGKSNSTYKPEDDCVCLLDWAFVLQKKGNIIEIVDPKLGIEFDEKEAAEIIKIALSCTNASPSLRPTMSEVVSMLEGQSAVKELESDYSIYGDALQFQQPKDFMSGSSKAPTTSSTFGEDLYPSYI